MIHIARKLVAKIAPSTVEDGTAPKNMKVGKVYPILGYQVQTVERDIRNRAGEEKGPKKVEEITGVFVIDDKRRLKYVYSSVMMFYLDKEELNGENQNQAGTEETESGDIPF